MQIKRFQGPDMRSALRQIRLELGADAVILSTRTTEGGVEVCAADDSDRPAVATAAPAPRAVIERAPVERVSPAAEQGAMSAELRSLRELLERQLDTLAWNDFTRRDPLRARALKELTELGMPRDDAWQLLQSIPAEALDTAGSQAHYDALAAALPTTELNALLTGAVALIGPPGAGKSTLLAKLAVRAVVEHGAARLAIITLDTQRLGAGDQARAIGRLLGIDTVAVGSCAELLRQRARWNERRLILVDTAGVLPRDSATLRSLQEQLAAVPELRALLVLPASAQTELLQCCLEKYAMFRPAAAVLTRIDEALSLGGAMAVLLRQALPVAAFCDGPRIPEDLQQARGAELVSRALTLKADVNAVAGGQHAAA